MAAAQVRAVMDALRDSRAGDNDDAPAAAASGARPVIALITACGPIVSGKGSATELQPNQEIASTPMCSKLVEARRDPAVKAVVLRIDSPGARDFDVLNHSSSPRLCASACIEQSMGVKPRLMSRHAESTVRNPSRGGLNSKTPNMHATHRREGCAPPLSMQ
jgi:hypothetical protein